MIIETAAITKTAFALTTAVLKSPTLRTAALRRVGRDPVQLALARAIEAALSDTRAAHPGWVSSLFDSSFLHKEAVPVLVRLITRGDEATPRMLAEAYADSVTSTDRRYALADEALSPCKYFLDSFQAYAEREKILSDLFTAKAVDASTEALQAIREKMGVGAVDSLSLRDYLLWIVDRNRYLDPRGTFQTQKQVQLRLREIFVSLDAVEVRSLSGPDREIEDNAEDDDPEFDRFFARPRRQDRTRAISKPRSLAEICVEHSHLVILGDPGSGKTTLLRHLALTHAEALLAAGVNTVSATRRLPVLIRVAAYAENQMWQKVSFSEFLGTYHEINECPATGIGELLKSQLTAGSCIVLLDGLDEITSTYDRVQVAQRIEEFVRRHARSGNRFLVTSRKAGYRDASLGRPFEHFQTRDMTMSQVQSFLQGWCRAVEDAETPEISEGQRRTNAAAEVTSILNAVERSPGVRRLAVNPLMLRILALIKRTGAQLPQKRVELYKMASDTLVRTWRVSQGVPESALAREEHVTPLLSYLAYWMHQNRPGGVARDGEVLEILGKEWARLKGMTWDEDNPSIELLAEVRDFLETVRIQTGIFVERGPRTYGFLHLTFEEYYAARYLIARPRIRAKLIRSHLHDPRWREPVLLALGFLGLDYQDDASELVEEAVLGQVDGELAEPSRLEEVLGRDLVFAIRCLADDIPFRAITARQVLGGALEEFVRASGRGQFQSFRSRVEEAMRTIQGSQHQALMAQILRDLSPDQLSETERERWLTASQACLAEEDILGRVVRYADFDHLPFTMDAAGAALEDALRSSHAVRAALRIAAAEGVGGNAMRIIANAIHDLEIPGCAGDLVAGSQNTSGGARAMCAGSLALAPESEITLQALEQLQSDADYRVRAAAALAVGWGPEDPRRVDALLDSVMDPALHVSQAAEQSLVMLASSPTVRQQLRERLPGGQTAQRRAIIAAIGSKCSDATELEETLAAGIHDPADEVRLAVASISGVIRARVGARAALLELAQDQSEEVRARAALGLSFWATDKAVQEQLRALLGDSSEQVRLNAVQSIAVSAETPETREALYSAVTQAASRRVSLLALARIANELDNDEAQSILPALAGLDPDELEFNVSAFAQYVTDATLSRWVENYLPELSGSSLLTHGLFTRVLITDELHDALAMAARAVDHPCRGEVLGHLSMWCRPADLDFVESLLRDPSAEIRATAADSIWYLRDGADVALRIATTLSQDTDPSVRSMAPRLVMSEAYGDAQLRILLRCLSDDDPSVCVAAVEAMNNVGRIPAVDAWFESIDCNSSTEIKQATAKLLIRRYGPRDGLTRLLPFATDASEVVREAVAIALNDPGIGTAGVDTLLALCGDADPTVSVTAIGRLANHWRDPRVIPCLWDFLVSGSPDQRQAAVDAFATQEPEWALRAAFEICTEAEPSLRAGALHLIGGAGESMILAECIESMLRAPEVEVRLAAVEALSPLESKYDRRILSDLARDPSVVVRAAVAGSPRYSRWTIPEELVTAYKGLLLDPVPLVSAAACRTLLGDPSRLPDDAVSSYLEKQSDWSRLEFMRSVAPPARDQIIDDGFLDRMLASTDSGLRYLAVWLLDPAEQTGGDLERILSLCTDADDEINAACIEFLSSVEEPDVVVVDALNALLGHVSVGNRARCVEGMLRQFEHLDQTKRQGLWLACWGQERIRFLVELAETRSLSEALESYRQMFSREELASLIPETLQYASSMATYVGRQNSLRVLAVMAAEELLDLEVLMEFFRDHDNDVRRAAAHMIVSLARFSDRWSERVKEALISALTDDRYLNRDFYEDRTGQDYVYAALVQLMSGAEGS